MRASFTESSSDSASESAEQQPLLPRQGVVQPEGTTPQRAVAPIPSGHLQYGLLNPLPEVWSGFQTIIEGGLQTIIRGDRTPGKNPGKAPGDTGLTGIARLAAFCFFFPDTH